MVLVLTCVQCVGSTHLEFAEVQEVYLKRILTIVNNTAIDLSTYSISCGVNEHAWKTIQFTTKTKLA